MNTKAYERSQDEFDLNQGVQITKVNVNLVN